MNLLNDPLQARDQSRAIAEAVITVAAAFTCQRAIADALKAAGITLDERLALAGARAALSAMRRGGMPKGGHV